MQEVGLMRFAGEKIPTLEEVLLLLTELGFNGQLNIERNKTDIIQNMRVLLRNVLHCKVPRWPFAIVYSALIHTLVELKN